MIDPLVSIVIATFDTGHYLPQTLESVFAQSYPAVEVVVVDDGSTDDTAARVEEFVAEHGAAVTFVPRLHGGLGPARNAGTEHAAGEYLLFLDADDLLEPDGVRVQVEAARRHPDAGIVFGDGTAFDDAGAESSGLYPDWLAGLLRDAGGEYEGDLYRKIVTGCPARCPAQALIPRDVAERTGPVCVTPNGAQDYDYYLRISREFRVAAHSAPIVRYRDRADSMSGPRRNRALRFAAQGIVLLERERNACPPELRSLLDDEIRRRATFGLRAATVAVADGGGRPDRLDLATLAPHLPRALRFAAGALGTLPPALTGRALDTARRVRRHRAAGVS